MRPIRALVVSPPAALWGAQLRLLNYAAPLADRGVDVVLGSPAEGDFHAAWVERGLSHRTLDIPQLDGIRVPETGRRPPIHRLMSTAIGSLSATTSITKAAKDYDVVWSFALRSHPAAVVAGRLRKVPTVVEVVDIVRPGVGRRVLRTTARGARSVIVNSEATGRAVGHDGVDLHVVHPGVDLDRYAPGPADPAVRSQLGVPGGVLVGILGRLDPMKGIHVLVEALGILGGRSDIRLAIVGSTGVRPDSYARTTRTRAEELLGDRVRFVGRRDDIPDVLRALDVVVNASFAEPFGRSVLEAQAVGRAVVAGNSGGIPEFVTDGSTGFLVPAGDPAALAAALQDVTADADLRRRVGTAARRQAEERFDIRDRYDMVAGILRRAAGASP